MTALSSPIWIQKPNPDAKLKILCFPFAGSGAGAFRNWNLGNHIEVASLQLPGREWRRDEVPLVSIESMVDDILPAVTQWLEDKKQAVFLGYSMGAILSYALITKIKQLGGRPPDALFVAASQAPQSMGKAEAIYRLSDEDFMVKIKNLGGMPAIIMEEPKLLELALPILKADFQALYHYQPDEYKVLDLPITVYGGSDDQHAPRNSLAGWRALTTNAEFRIRLFSGGHFFMNSAREQLLKTLEADLTGLLCL